MWLLEISWRDAGALGDARQHLGPEFLVIVKSEDDVRPAWSFECAV